MIGINKRRKITLFSALIVMFVLLSSVAAFSMFNAPVPMSARAAANGRIEFRFLDETITSDHTGPIEMELWWVNPPAAGVLSMETAIRWDPAIFELYGAVTGDRAGGNTSRSDASISPGPGPEPFPGFFMPYSVALNRVHVANGEARLYTSTGQTALPMIHNSTFLVGTVSFRIRSGVVLNHGDSFGFEVFSGVGVLQFGGAMAGNVPIPLATIAFQNFDLPVQNAVTSHSVNFSMVNPLSGVSLTATANGVAIANGASVAGASNLVFSAVPNAGQRVAAWRLNGVVQAGQTGNTFSHNNLSGNINVTVEFEPIPATNAIVAYSVAASGGGSLLASFVSSGASIGASPASVPIGSAINFTATPGPNYAVSAWHVDGITTTTTDATRTIVANANTNIRVYFARRQQQINFSKDAINHGGASTIVANSGGNIASGSSINAGSNVTFTMTAAAGFRLSRLTINGIDASLNAPIGDITTHTLTNVQADTTVIAHFIAQHAVTFSTYSGNGAISITTAGTTTSISPLLVDNGQFVSFNAVPNSGFRVSAWRVNGTVVDGLTGTTYTHPSPIGGTLNVTVEFELIPPPQIDQFVVFFNAMPGGTVTATATPSAAAPLGLNAGLVNNVHQNASITFTASPSAGFHISHWIRNGIELGHGQTSFVINPLIQNETIMAVFAQNTHTVSFSVLNASGGQISINNQAAVLSGSFDIVDGASASFLAVPAPNYVISAWRINGAIVPNNTSANLISGAITQDTVVSVEFARVFSVVFSASGNGTVTANALGAGIASGTNIIGGTSINFVAAPLPGFRVSGFSVNGVLNQTQNTSHSVVINSDTVVIVYFEALPAATYTVTYSVLGIGGTISAIGIGASPYSASQGTNFTLVAFANPGYEINEWIIDGVVQSGTSNMLNISNLSNDTVISVSFRLINHTVTYNVFNGTGGTISVQGGTAISTSNTAVVANNNTITFNATPNAGFRIREWRVGDFVITGHTANIFVSPQIIAATTITVVFELDLFSVSFSSVSNLAWGTLSANSSGTNLTSGQSLGAGSNIIFSANPSINFAVYEWRINGIPVINNISNTLEIVSLNENIVVSIEFNRSWTVSYSIDSSTPHGGITSGGTSTGSITRLEGTVVTLVATPDVGFRVREWRVGAGVVSNTSNTLVLEPLSSNVTVVVVFEVVPPPIVEISVFVNGGGGSLSAVLNGNTLASVAAVSIDSDIVFSATANPGFRVASWLVEYSIIPSNWNTALDIASNLTSQTVTNIQHHHRVTVTFERILYTVSFNTLDANGTILANGGAIDSGDSVYALSTVSFLATANSGFMVGAWRLNGVLVESNTTSNFVIAALNGNVVVTVDFIQVFSVNFNIAGDPNGAISANVANGASFVYGTAISFSAIPVTGFMIGEWTLNGDIVGSGAFFSVASLSQDIIVTVSFVAIEYTILFSTNGNGTISANGGAFVSGGNMSATHGQSIVFNVHPSVGFRVAAWHINGAQVAASTNTHTLYDISQSSTITVFIEPDSHQINFSVIGGGYVIEAFYNGVSITSGQSVSHLADLIFSANNPGTGYYAILGWTINGVPSGSTTPCLELLNIANSFNIVLNTIAQHLVSYEVIGANGTLTASVIGGTRINTGTTVVFSAAPNAGYVVSEWLINGLSLIPSNGRNLVLTRVINEDMHVTVSFEPVSDNEHVVIFNNVGGGQVLASANGSSIISGAAVAEGSHIMFEAIPNAGSRILSWTINGVVTLAYTNNFVPFHFQTLNSQLTVTVEFEAIEYMISFGDDITAVLDAVNISSGTLVSPDAVVVLTATVPSGHRVLAWIVNGARIVTDSLTHNLGALTGDVFIDIEFIQTFVVQFSTQNASIAAFVGGMTISNNALVDINQSVHFELTPNSGYRVMHWLVNGAVFASTLNTFTHPILTGNLTVEAVLETIYVNVVYGVYQNQTDRGTIWVLEGGAIQRGASRTFFAQSNQGFVIYRFIVNGVTHSHTGNSIVLTINEDTTVFVEFDQAFLVSYTIIGNGNLSLEAGGVSVINGVTILKEGTQINFAIAPSARNEIESITINGVSMPIASVFSFDMPNESIDIVIVFRAIEYSVVFGVNIASGGTLTGQAILAGISTSLSNSPAQVASGATIIFNAMINTNYVISHWVIDGTVVANTSAIQLINQLNGNLSVQVVFELVGNAVNFSVTQGQGTITAFDNTNSINLASGDSAPIGSQISFNATPSLGYQIRRWTIGGVTVDGHTASTLNHTLSGGVVVTVEFERSHTTLTYQATTIGGTLSAHPPVSNNSQIERGSVISFSATPSQNFAILEFRVNGVVFPHVGNTLTITINDASIQNNYTHVTVVFELTDATVNFYAQGGGVVTATMAGVNIASGITLDPGTELVFNAVPNAGYKILEWRLNGAVVAGEGVTSLTRTTDGGLFNLVVIFSTGHIVTFGAGSGGSIAGSVGTNAIASGDMVFGGSTANFIATANSGYRIYRWLVNGAVDSAITGNTFNTVINGSTNISVEFIRTHSVVFSAGENGTLTANIDGENVANGARIDQGTNIDFVASPSMGHRVAHWIVNGDIIDSNLNTLSHPALDGNLSVSVVFELINHTVSFSSGIEGQISAVNNTLSQAIAISPASVAHGNIVTFNATPNSLEYVISQFLVNDQVVAHTAGSITITITGDTVVRVYFAQASHTVNFIAIGNGDIVARVNGDLIVSGAVVDTGNIVNFVAAPNAGYVIYEWRLNGTRVAGSQATFNYTKGANIAHIEVMFVAGHTVTFSANGGGIVFGIIVDASVTLTTSPASVLGGSIITFIGDPHPNYRIVAWIVNGVRNETNSTTFVSNPINANLTVVVEFELRQYMVVFSPNVTASANGVAISSGDDINAGSNLVFTAHPPAGRQVVYWLVDGVAVQTSGNVFTLSALSANTIIEAVFDQIELPPDPGPGETAEQFVVHFGTIGGGGTVSATANGVVIVSGTMVDAGTRLVFSAAPNYGYRISEWNSAGSTLPTRALEVTIDEVLGHIIINVLFELIPEIGTVPMGRVRFFDSVTEGVDEDTLIWEGYVEYGTFISDILPDNPIRDNVIFVRWAGFSAMKTVTGDHDFHAVYVSENAERFSVYFFDEENRLIALFSDVLYGTYVSSLFPTPPAIAGRVFVGWQGYEAGMIVDRNLNFVAIYVSENARRFVLVFINYDYQIIRIVNNVLEGTPIAMHVIRPQREGYVFDRWNGLEAGMRVTDDHAFLAVFRAEGDAGDDRLAGYQDPNASWIPWAIGGLASGILLTTLALILTRKRKQEDR